MATKKYLTLAGLTEYDELIKAEIAEGDASVKSYVDTEVAKKADKTHNHDDLYYTEAEIDQIINDMNESFSEIIIPLHEGYEAIVEGTITVPKATSADRLDGQLPSYYAKASDIPTGALADKDIVSESDLDSALAAKVNAAAQGNHSHSNKTVLDGITSTKVSNWDSAETNANAYTDEKIANLLDNSTEAVDSIMELAAAMEDNADAIDALEEVAASKVPTSRKVNGKALTADITLSASDVGADASGSAAAVQTNLDTHIADTTKHITSTERTNWGAAYTHSQAAHAPSNAQANVIESIKVNGVAQTITSKAVDITVPTKASDIGAAESTHSHAISDITNLQTTLNNAASGIQTNTNSINAHTDRISALETKVGDGFSEITSSEIQALFA